MRLGSLLLLSLTLAPAACGGVVDAPSPSGSGTSTNPPESHPVNPTTSTTPTTTGPLDVEGSFEVTFDEVKATIDPGGPTPPSTTPPSQTAKVRLDIRASGTGYEAVLTPRWGTPRSYAVTVTSGDLTLVGDGSIAGSNGYSGVADRWTKLVLERDTHTGFLLGTISGEGDETIGQGDVVWQGKLWGIGKVARDKTAPELRADLTRGPADPSGTLLPWDPIAITVAEPVNVDGIEEQTHVDGPDGDSLTIRWEPLATRPESWAGETQFVGHVDDWTRAASGEPWNLINGGALVKDRVGLTSASFARALSFVRLAGPAQTVGFDDDVTFASPWGSYEIYGGGLTGQPDARCENGGCLRIGPVTYDMCAIPHAGFAAQLQRLAQGHVALRYRVLAEPSYPPSGDTAPPIYGNLLTLEVASPGATTLDRSVSSSDAPLAKLAAPVDGMSFGTEWTTLDVAAPASPAGSSAPIGVAVFAGDSSITRGGCGGPPPPPTKVEILVEKVSSN